MRRISSLASLVMGSLFSRRGRPNLLDTIYSDDVFLISYPRSGNTWMRYLMANLFEPDKEWNITSLGRVIPDIHEAWPKDWIERSPRFIKSHETYQPAFSKVIYIYRDGRDVAVSYYDYLTKVKDYRGSFDRFLLEFLEGKFRYGSWHTHVSSWLFDDHPVELFASSYESLVRDTRCVIEELSRYLGIKWKPENIRAAIEKSTIEKQEEDYRVYKTASHWNKGFKGGVHRGPFVWKSVFTSEQNNIFWREAGNVAKRLGYSRE